MAVPFVQETSTVVERFARQGRLFAASHRWAGLVSGASAELVLQNPSDSGVDLYILVLQVIGTGQAHVDMYADSTGVGSGTSITPANKYIGYPTSSVTTVEVDGTYTPGQQIHQTVVPGGSGVFAIGGSTELGVGGIIAEGHTLHIKVTNASTNAEDFSIRLVWWEKEW